MELGTEHESSIVEGKMELHQTEHDRISWARAGRFLSQTEELAKAGTCVRDRRALQQLALNVHVKHSDLTWLDLADYKPGSTQ